MQLPDQLAQRVGVAGIERLDDLLDIVRAQISLVVARRNGGQRRGHVLLVEHAGPSSQRTRRIVRASTPERSQWQLISPMTKAWQRGHSEPRIGAGARD